MATAAESVTAAVGRRVVAAYCRRALRRAADLHVKGLEHVPRRGPALIAARHVHHLYDGCALVATLPRPIHLLIALDWVKPGRDRRLMEWGCRTLRWPTIFRSDAPTPTHDHAEAARYLRQAARDTVSLLRADHLLVVFPEAFPNIDPHPTPKSDLDAFLPFRPGFVRLAALAQRDGHGRVPIIPTGFHYQPGARWSIHLRFGPPCYLDGASDPAALVQQVEDRVRALSQPAAN